MSREKYLPEERNLFLLVEECFLIADDFLTMAMRNHEIDGAENEEEIDEREREQDERFQCSLQKVIDFLSEDSDHLLLRTNHKGQTALHIAAKGCKSRTGHAVEARVNEVIVEQLIQNKKLLWIRDNDSNLAIHVAIKHNNFKAACAMFRKMQECKQTTKYEDYNRGYDESPLLHFSMYYQPSRKFVKLVLEAFPVSASITHDGDLPLTKALEHYLPARKVRLLVQAYPKALEIPTADGDLPLHLAAIYYANSTDELQVIRLLKTFYPKAILSKNKHGQFPLHCALECEYSNRMNPPSLELIETLCDKDSQPTSTIAQYADVEFGLHSFDISIDSLASDFTRKKGNMSSTKSETAPTSAVALQQSDSYGELPLHLACRRVFDIETETLRWILDQNSSAITIPNKHGHLPLHLAAAEAASSGSSSDKLIANLTLLIKAYPESLWQPDDEGDIPLQCVLSDGNVSCKAVECFLMNYSDTVRIPSTNGIERIWHPTTNRITGQSPLHFACANGVSLDVLDLLIRQFPESLMQYDVNGHLPFHIALLYSTEDVRVLQTLLFGNSTTSFCNKNEHEETYVSAKQCTTLPATECGVPALFLACDASEDHSPTDTNSLDIIRFLVERSPELFLRQEVPKNPR
jgi:ankyrin repeat protein